MAKEKIYMLDTRHLKGDGCYYLPKGLMGRIFCIFAKRFSHTSRLMSKLREYDAAIEFKGVTINRTNWERKPVLVPMPHDKDAHKATEAEYGTAEYGKLQVISKALKSRKFLIRDHTDCAETKGFYTRNHKWYKKALKDNNEQPRRTRIPKKLIKKVNDPSSLTPWDVYRVDRILNRRFSRKPVVKVVKIVGKDIYVKEYKK